MRNATLVIGLSALLFAAPLPAAETLCGSPKEDVEVCLEREGDEATLSVEWESGYVSRFPAKVDTTLAPAREGVVNYLSLMQVNSKHGHITRAWLRIDDSAATLPVATKPPPVAQLFYSIFKSKWDFFGEHTTFVLRAKE